MVTDAKLEAERERLSMNTPTLHKDLSLISLVPKWSGLESNPLEFLDNIESSALIGRWDEADRLKITTLRLTDATKYFIMVVQNSMKKTRIGRILKAHSGGDLEIYTPIDNIL
jgi:hypothetical protein